MGLTVFIRKAVYDRVNDLFTQVATPRVVERERELLDRVDHELGVLVAELENCVRARDGELRLLDSAELRLALGDLRERRQLFARCLERGALGVGGLFAFIDSVTKMGVADVKAAASVDEVADAVSRTVDHVQDYMIGHDLLDPDALNASRLVRPEAVRKVRLRTTHNDAVSWHRLREQVMRLGAELEIDSGSGRATLA